MNARDWTVGLLFGFLLRVVPGLLTPFAQRFDDVPRVSSAILIGVWVVVLAQIFMILRRRGVLHVVGEGTRKRRIVRFVGGALGGYLIGVLTIITAMIGVSDVTVVARLFSLLLLGVLLLVVMPILIRRGVRPKAAAAVPGRWRDTNGDRDGRLHDPTAKR